MGRSIFFCRVISVLQMGLSPSLSLTHERRHVSGSSAKGAVAKPELDA